MHARSGAREIRLTGLQILVFLGCSRGICLFPLRVVVDSDVLPCLYILPASSSGHRDIEITRRTAVLVSYMLGIFLEFSGVVYDDCHPYLGPSGEPSVTENLGRRALRDGGTGKSATRGLHNDHRNPKFLS
jgi:hypothetical protein